MIERSRSMQRRGCSQATMILTLLGLFASMSGAWAAVNLPVHHWAYDELERLAVIGLIDRAMLSTKPFSRTAAAKLVAKAIRKIEAGRTEEGLATAEVEQALADLRDEFQEELIALGVEPTRTAPGMPPLAALPTMRYRFADPLRVEVFGADINSKTPAPPPIGGHADFRQPGFRPNFRGESFRDGLNVQSELRTWAEVGDHFGLSFNPKFIHSDQSDQLQVKELYGKFTLSNVDLLVGRDSMWWGPGYSGTILMTDNARSFDLLKIGSVEPFRLPWVFRPLGDFTFTMFATKLRGDDGNPKFVGTRIGWMPASWFEFGANRMIIFGKDGQGTRFVDFWRGFFRTKSSGANSTSDFRTKSDERITMDFRTLVPLPEALSFGKTMQFYGELGGEEGGTYFLEDLFWQTGVFIPGFIWSGTDLRIEYSNSQSLDNPIQPFADYNHHIFTSGYRFQRNMIGHNMGSNADAIFVRLTQHLTPTLRLNLALEQQRHGIKNCVPGAVLPNSDIVCPAALLPVGEKERSVILGLTANLSPQLRFEPTVSLQRLTNEGGVSGLNDWNRYVGAALSFRY